MSSILDDAVTQGQITDWYVQTDKEGNQQPVAHVQRDGAGFSYAGETVEEAISLAEDSVRN